MRRATAFIIQKKHTQAIGNTSGCLWRLWGPLSKNSFNFCTTFHLRVPRLVNLLHSILVLRINRQDGQDVLRMPHGRRPRPAYPVKKSPRSGEKSTYFVRPAYWDFRPAYAPTQPGPSCVCPSCLSPGRSGYYGEKLNPLINGNFQNFRKITKFIHGQKNL